jgi:ankyrin repeat protein
VEELSLEFDAAVVQFIEAATDGRSDRAERLLALHPRIARANFHTALLLGDTEAAESWLAQDPSLVERPGGPRGWEPLLYICHTSLQRGHESRAAGFVAIARNLLARGANPNVRFPWLHHGVRRAALWGATFVTQHLPLVELLLDAGADPNDGVTLPIAAGAGNVAVLELLHRYGADVNQPWATDGAATIYSVLHWTDAPVGAQWLLDHGADADPVFASNGETPLHVVARRGNVALAAALVTRGADITRTRADGRTPYAVAALNGNHEVADWLLAQGAPGELSEVDRLVAACSSGDRAAVAAMLATRPALRAEIRDEHYIALHQAAERGDTEALAALLACGFDPNRGDDEMGKTALHSAAHGGRPDAIRILLEHGASVTIRDREFHAQPLVWAAEASRGERADGRDYLAVGQLLLDAGSPVDWEVGDEPAEGILEILAEWRRLQFERRG